MDKKNSDPVSNESSLLLKYPIDLFSPHSNNENILMPIGVPEPSGNRSNENIKTEDAQNISESRIPSSVCQLEQPLLYRRRVSSPDISEVASTSLYREKVDTDAPPSPQYVYPELASIYSDSTSQRKSSLPAYPDHTASTSPALYSECEPFVSSLAEKSKNDLTGFVKPYWMFQDNVESKEIWYGFSERDNENLEKAFESVGYDFVIPTDGGRYDVYLRARVKKSVYFMSKELPVRRCTWFYQQDSMPRVKPYDERVASYLEQTYQQWIYSDEHYTRFVIPNYEGAFVFEKPAIMLQYIYDSPSWNGPGESKLNPRNVIRGALPDGFQILPNESPQIDNLLFIVQGIGSFCDLRFRTVSECVDGFREISNKLIDSHFRNDVSQGRIGRVEILPVAWHAKFRTSDIGLDRTMKRITLPSIPKLRHFTNDTLIDILLYSSPSYCQSILDTVAEELNAMYETFISRNPGFTGKVFVAGHSLGSLIIFDILSNQDIEESSIEKEISSTEENLQADLKKTIEDFSDVAELLKSLNLEDYSDAFKTEKIDLSTLPYLSEEDLTNLGLPLGPRRKLMSIVQSKEKVSSTTPNLSESRKFASSEKLYDKLENTPRNLIFPFQKPNTGVKPVIYPRLHFQPSAFFAMGSPISMFLAIRGFDAISEKYSFPTCPAFFHIFHPYDPVAFRIEPMIDRMFDQKPVLIPHHKGRKRMHLEIKENVANFAREMRQKVLDTFYKTWNSFSGITRLQSFPSAAVEKEVNSIISQGIPKIPTFDDNSSVDLSTVSIGNLNGGRRIDYVLQEKPLEALNDYVWALTSHATYWDSEDTVLMILREIYSTQGITVSLPNENENLVPEDISTADLCANEHLPFSNEFFEKTLYSSLPASEEESINISAPLTSTIKHSASVPTMPLSSEAPVFVPGAQYHNAPLTTTVIDSVGATSMPSYSGASISNPGSQYSSVPLASTVKSYASATMMPPSSGTSVSIPGSQHHGVPSASTVKTSVSAPNMPSSSGTSVSIPGSQHHGVPSVPTIKTSVSATSMPSSSGASVSVPGSQHIGPPPLSGFVKRSPFTK